jgi:hypothetical protein
MPSKLLYFNVKDYEALGMVRLTIAPPSRQLSMRRLLPAAAWYSFRLAHIPA